ncbi:MAG: T9SS type A sorting domain-containing protein [Bacteroidota bacterium]
MKKTTFISFLLTALLLGSGTLIAQVNFMLQLGTGTSGDSDGAFQFPEGVAVNPQTGMIYVGDRSNERIQIFDGSGTYIGQFGSKGSGVDEFSNGGPTDLAFDPAGNIWITDQSNDRVLQFTADGVFLQAIGSSGSGIGEFDQTQGVAVHPVNGNVYVADRNNERIQIFSPTGSFLAQFGGEGTAAGQFATSGAEDLTFDQLGNVWVVDKEGHRVQQFDAAGNFIQQIGTGSPGLAAGVFRFPAGVAVHPLTGDIYISDRNNERIQYFLPDGTYLGEFGGLGTGAGEFANNGAVDLAFDGNGILYVVDRGNHRVQRFSTPGSVLPVILGDFFVSKQENAIAISWATFREQNFSHFVLERSLDGRTFGEIAQVAGLGDSDELQQYVYTDDAPLNNATLYYRLTMVDLDGTQSFSSIESIHFQNRGGVSAYPNPATHSINLSWTYTDEQLQRVSVHNMAGQRIDCPLTTKYGSVSLNIAHLQPGMYLIRLQSKSIREEIKFLKVR